MPVGDKRTPGKHIVQEFDHRAILYPGLWTPLSSCDIKHFSGRVIPGSTKIIAKWLTSRGWVSTVPTLLPRSGGDVYPAAVENGAVTGGARRPWARRAMPWS